MIPAWGGALILTCFTSRLPTQFGKFHSRHFLRSLSLRMFWHLLGVMAHLPACEVRSNISNSLHLYRLRCFSGMCRTGYAYVCPGSVTRTRTLPTNCTPWSRTFLSPHAKVNALFMDFSIQIMKQKVPFIDASLSLFPNRSADSQCWWKLNLSPLRVE